MPPISFSDIDHTREGRCVALRCVSLLDPTMVYVYMIRFVCLSKNFIHTAVFLQRVFSF